MLTPSDIVRWRSSSRRMRGKDIMPRENSNSSSESAAPQPEPARSRSWHRRRLRRARPSPRTRSARHHRLLPRGRSLPSRVASRRLRRTPLPRPRTERHRRHGRHPARRVSLTRASRTICRSAGSTNSFAGFLKLAQRYSVTLAGGDTAQSPDGILADIIVIGAIPTGKAILRSSARAGDIIYVSGTLGASVATLQELRSGKKLRPRPTSGTSIPTRASPSANTCAKRNSPPP